MRFNVAGLLKSPTGTDRVVTLEEPVELDDADVRVLEPVRGRIRLTRDHAGILVEGHLSTRLGLACARCLEPAEADVSVDIAEEFRPTVYIPGGPPVADPEEVDPEARIDEFHVLDLGEVVRQALEVAVPLHPLCRPDCAGLCPTCGVDRNRGSCDCEPAPDPRWETLRALLEEETDG
jgi:uncharacterized protein